MRARMAVALLSLVGVFVALYLYLHKLGFIGHLACGSGGCETVQLSGYSRFLGVDVPFIGLVGYAALLLISLVSLERPGDSRWPRFLLWISGVGVVFSAYLTYLELFVIRAICRWCLGSAAIILLIFLAAWQARRPGGSPTA